MRIDNVKVYDLEESIVASGLPMQAEYDPEQFKELAESGNDVLAKDIGRATRLAHNAPGTGHCNFLSGILVSYNVTATQAWWMQMERYHFNQIVSSQSKMHRLAKMKIGTTCHPKTDEGSVAFAEVLQDGMKCDVTDFEQLVYSCPMGLELTARCTTNYLQLKTIWNQRHEHKLQEWREFCNWIRTLPYASEFIIGTEVNQ